MKKDIAPIFDFKPLRDFLTDKGFIVEQAHGYREIRPEEVTLDDINKGDIKFTDEGIYVIGPDDEKQQVFLYKRDYHLNKYGKPRFHICRCDTIEIFIANRTFREHYVRANSDPVPVMNLDNNNKEEMVDKLPLCKYCIKKLEKYGSISSSDFVEILRQIKSQDNGTAAQRVDIFGYTKDWDKISREYREKHNYTCDECGLQISNVFDRQYIHVHHIDGNKLNNKESNLKCLCFRCHSQVDETHYKRLTTGANRISFEAFNTAYPKQPARYPGSLFGK